MHSSPCKVKVALHARLDNARGKTRHRRATKGVRKKSKTNAHQQNVTCKKARTCHPAAAPTATKRGEEKRKQGIEGKGRGGGRQERGQLETGSSTNARSRTTRHRFLTGSSITAR